MYEYADTIGLPSFPLVHNAQLGYTVVCDRTIIALKRIPSYCEKLTVFAFCQVFCSIPCLRLISLFLRQFVWDFCQ